MELFDRGRGTSLHLFEHVHGDSRDRGPAMIDLAGSAAAGLTLVRQAPDYLQGPSSIRLHPAAARHAPSSVRWRTSSMPIFGALQQRGSAYASVLGALLELAGEQAQPVKTAPEEPLDESWAEPVVFDGCSSQRPGPAGSGAAHTYCPRSPFRGRGAAL